MSPPTPPPPPPPPPPSPSHHPLLVSLVLLPLPSSDLLLQVSSFDSPLPIFCFEAFFIPESEEEEEEEEDEQEEKDVVSSTPARPPLPRHRRHRRRRRCLAFFVDLWGLGRVLERDDTCRMKRNG